MQFKDIEQLKQFIQWAKSKQLAHVQVGEISFTFSDARIMTEPAPGEAPGSSPTEPDPDQPPYKPNSKSWVDVDQSEENEEDLLFYSATPN